MPGERLKVVELAKDSSEYEEVEKSFLASAKYNITIEKVINIFVKLLNMIHRTTSSSCCVLLAVNGTSMF